MRWGTTRSILTKFAAERVAHLRIWEEVPVSNLGPEDGLSRLRFCVVFCSPSINTERVGYLTFHCGHSLDIPCSSQFPDCYVT